MRGDRRGRGCGTTEKECNAHDGAIQMRAAPESEDVHAARSAIAARAEHALLTLGRDPPPATPPAAAGDCSSVSSEDDEASEAARPAAAWAAL